MNLRVSNQDVFVAKPLFCPAATFIALDITKERRSRPFGYTYFTQDQYDGGISNQLIRQRNLPLKKDSSRRSVPIGGIYERESSDLPLHPLSPVMAHVTYNRDVIGRSFFLSDEEVQEVICSEADYSRYVAGRWMHSTSFSSGKSDWVDFAIPYGFYNGKIILQQIGTVSCTAACSAMLMLDHGVRANLSELFHRNYGDSDLMVQDLILAGLDAFYHSSEEGSDKAISKLAQLVARWGACIVCLRTPGAHAVILDEINIANNKVVLRDPFHGWMIRTSVRTFASKYMNEAVFVSGKLNKQ